MEPTTIYCLFMLSCFSSRLSGGIYELDCPAGCDCFSASSDGISGDTSLSFICDQTSVLHRYSSFRSSLINTLVVRLSPIFISSRPQSSRKHPALSLVLEQCTLGTPTDPSNIFQLLDPKSLQYLTITQSTLFESKTSLDWTHLAPFNNLQTLYIEDTTGISTLDQTFSSISSPHTVTIKRCPISHIDRDAFNGKQNTLQRLTITGTEIQNFLWLTANDRVYNNLWYLDLRDNQLLYFSERLRAQLPKLQVLYLAQNNLQHFSEALLKPWFSINELMLISDSTGAFHRPQAYPPVIYNKEMSELQRYLTTGTSNDQVPAHLIDSFQGSSVKYRCHILEKSTTTSAWKNLIACSQMIYQFYPDNLFVDHKGQLTISKALGNEVLDQVKIEGYDLNALQVFNGQSEFYLDSIKTADDYRQARALLINLLNSLPVGNSLRVNLFSRRTFDIFASSISNDNLKNDFSLLLDFLEDIFNVAEAAKKYVMLVMWRYEDIDWELINQPSRLSSILGKMRLVLPPMYQRISKLPSLIGTEVMANFLAGEFTSSSFIVNADCTSTVAHFWKKLQFLGHSLEAIYRASPSSLIGVNIPGDCEYCLHGAMMYQCQQVIGFTISAESTIDFVSITSSSNADMYGPDNWKTKKPAWFDALYLKPNDKSPGRPIRPGVFYILQDASINVQKNADILTWAAGVYVALQRNTVFYNVETDDTLGNFTV